MKRASLVLALALMGGLTLLPTGSWAGSMLSIAVKGGTLRATASGSAVGPLAAGGLILGAGAFGAAASNGPTHFIVDATPLEAQVFLDGRLLGTAHQLVARAFPLAPGQHAVEIVVPTFRSYIAQFSSVPGGFPIRLRVALVPE